jgi:hypothetical protein
MARVLGTERSASRAVPAVPALSGKEESPDSAEQCTGEEPGIGTELDEVSVTDSATENDRFSLSTCGEGGVRVKTWGKSSRLMMATSPEGNEPGALIGFAGPRVIQDTIRQELPPGFQRAEFLLHHGFVDMIVDRKNLRPTLIQLLDFLIGTPAGASRP